MNIALNLFRNTKKADNHPDMRGNGKDLDTGIEYEIAAWTKIDKNGNKYLSCKVSEKRQSVEGVIDELRNDGYIKQSAPQYSESQQAVGREITAQGFADKDSLPF